ncbi:MAG TPA: IS1 family transposase [Candidatus Aquicultor sp.]|jgi:IS1 family transposase
MNKLSVEKRAQIIGCLVEGMSIRGTVRITGAAKNTVTKLLVDLGNACSDYQDKVMHDLPCKKLQFDEIWSFVYAKQKNVPEEHQGEYGYGDVWTWVALDADTKLVPSWLVGERNTADARAFVADVASRLRNKVQLTTDGYKPYLEAIEKSFGGDIDYAVLHKLYGTEPETQKRYSPAHCIGAEVKVIAGNPDIKYASTSYVERQNLTMRMGMRRFTRLTNAFSKKAENLAHAVSLHFMYYNFARPHKTLSGPYKTTPAMAAGIADHVWTLEEIAKLLD